jgi:hypothetical protein
VGQLAITLEPGRTAGVCCLCDQPLAPTSGPGLSLTQCSSPVCESCGKKHAPVLAALLELGRVADRVGWIGKHCPLLPLRTLLDLAHVAEKYADSQETTGCDEGSVQAVSRPRTRKQRHGIPRISASS